MLSSPLQGFVRHQLSIHGFLRIKRSLRPKTGRPSIWAEKRVEVTDVSTHSSDARRALARGRILKSFDRGRDHAVNHPLNLGAIRGHEGSIPRWARELLQRQECWGWCLRVQD